MVLVSFSITSYSESRGISVVKPMSTFSDVVCWSCSSELRLIAFSNWVVRLPFLLTIGSYIQWLLDLSLRAPFAASSSITRSIGMIPAMMSRAAPGVGNSPVMRILHSRCTLLRIVKLCFLDTPLSQILCQRRSDNSCIYPFHGLGGEPPCWSNGSSALHELMPLAL